MKILKKIIKPIATIFLILLVSLCIYTFIATDIQKKAYTNIFGYSYFVVATGSMSGTIEVNDIIFVKITKDVKENDIITYLNEDDEIITHRLVKKEGNYYITKGDINNTEDSPVKKNQIVGKVTMIISPSFILKCIAIFLIIFIFLALINFDVIVKKVVVKEEKKKLPDDIFKNPKKREEEQQTGLTVTIAFNEMENLNKQLEQEEKEAEIEILEYDEYLEKTDYLKKNKNDREQETISFIVSILKCKKNNTAKARMNKKWLTRYQYVYKLCHLLLISDTKKIVEEITNPPFREIYDYDLDKVGLTDAVRNRIYEMPIHAFLRILTYSILYNDDEMFDGIYKILKYKIMVDKDNYFKIIKKTDTYSIKQIKSLILFMKKIAEKFDNKKVFELEKVERITKIRSY